MTLGIELKSLLKGTKLLLWSIIILIYNNHLNYNNHSKVQTNIISKNSWKRIIRKEIHKKSIMQLTSYGRNGLKNIVEPNDFPVFSIIKHKTSIPNDNKLWIMMWSMNWSCKISEIWLELDFKKNRLSVTYTMQRTDWIALIE